MRLTGVWISAADTCPPETRYSQYDKVARRLTVHLCHFSQYGLFYQTPPVAVVQVPEVVQTGPAGTASLVVNGSGSFDPDSNVSLASYSWTVATPSGTIQVRGWALQVAGVCIMTCLLYTLALCGLWSRTSSNRLSALVVTPHPPPHHGRLLYCFCSSMARSRPWRLSCPARTPSSSR